MCVTFVPGHAGRHTHLHVIADDRRADRRPERVGIGHGLRALIVRQRSRVVVLAHEVDLAAHRKDDEAHRAQSKHGIERRDGHSPVHSHFHDVLRAGCRAG